MLVEPQICREEIARRVAERNRPGETVKQALERIRIASEQAAPILAFYGDKKTFRIDAAQTKDRAFTDTRAHLRRVFGLAY